MRQCEISQAQASNTFMEASQSQSMSRRGFCGLFLTGLTSAALVACGGGSDPTGVTESSDDSSLPRNLASVWNRLASGMVKQDVINMVGMAPNALENEGSMKWNGANDALWVNYDATSLLVTSAWYTDSNGKDTYKDVYK